MTSSSALAFSPSSFFKAVDRPPINPKGAAERIAELLRELGYSGVKIAAVDGSLITERVLDLTATILESGQPTASLKDSLVSAEAYMGAEPIVQALREGAQIVVTGRVADPSLFVAPMMYEFGWAHSITRRLGPAAASVTFWSAGHR